MSNKVIHLVYSFGCGGLEKVIANLINHSTQYDVEHIVVSLTDDVSMSDQISQPIKVIVLNKRAGNDFKSHQRLFALLKQLRPKAINTYNFGTIEYHFTAMLAGVKKRVHSDHGRGGDDPQGKNWLHNAFRKIIAHFISEYIVVSYDLYDWIINQLKIKKEKVSLIFNGVEVPTNFIEPKNNKIFVTIGRLDKVKNQKLLIDAFGHAIKTEPEFSQCILNIVGDGPLKQELEAHVECLKLNQSVKFLGYREDISDILNKSDVFVLSSVYEAMPMTILEAMANSTPVISTNVGGISKFITEREAWFVDSNHCEQLSQQLIEIRKLTDLDKNKVKNAYNLVKENYSVDKMVKNYMTKYQIEIKCL